MNPSAQIASHIRQVFFGGNWTSVAYRDHIQSVSWQFATQPLSDSNTIAVLLAHVTYYVDVINRVLEEGVLQGKDAESFAHPPIQNEEDWEAFQQQAWSKVIRMVDLVTALPEEQREEPFTDEKYGSYHRNLLGFIEHTHYHLGQSVLLNKLLVAAVAAP